MNEWINEWITELHGRFVEMLSHLKIGQNRNKEYIKKPNEKERKINETIENDKKNKINEWEWKKEWKLNKWQKWW